MFRRQLHYFFLIAIDASCACVCMWIALHVSLSLDFFSTYTPCIALHFCFLLKEIGDVENWAARLEEDMYTVVKTLEYASAEAGSDAHNQTGDAGASQ
eukprot:m.66647 g.66647  ORF g.66647 m.66647 type:complete len:98 (+) comp12129_c0_seq3:709-1002(+)